VVDEMLAVAPAVAADMMLVFVFAHVCAGNLHMSVIQQSPLCLLMEVFVLY